MRGKLEGLMYLCDELNYALPTRIFFGGEQRLLTTWQQSFVTRRERERDCSGYVLVKRCSG